MARQLLSAPFPPPSASTYGETGSFQEAATFNHPIGLGEGGSLVTIDDGQVSQIFVIPDEVRVQKDFVFPC